jgi:hypothetical protein
MHESFPMDIHPSHIGTLHGKHDRSMAPEAKVVNRCNTRHAAKEIKSSAPSILFDQIKRWHSASSQAD